MTQPRRSAGIVIVRRENDEWRFLLLRAYRNWDFPKGLIDPGEGPLEAAIREAKEEADIDRDDLSFKWGGVHTETPPYGNRKIARYYLAETRRSEITLPVSPELGKPEHDEWRWVTYKKGLNLCAPRLKSVLEWAHVLIERKS